MQSHYYWWFLQPWFLLVAMVVTADFWWNRRSRPLATVAVGWLAIWLTVASAWPAKNYLVRVTLPPEQRLTPNVQKLRELIPTGARVLTSIGWWALGNDRSVYDPHILRHSGPRSHRVFRNGQQWHRPTRRLVAGRATRGTMRWCARALRLSPTRFQGRPSNFSDFV